MILKQQRVIKKLLKKCYGTGGGGASGSIETKDDVEALVSDAARALGNHLAAGGGTKSKKENGGDCRPPTSELLDAQNDSDSAVILEDHCAEVSLLVPSLSQPSLSSCGGGGASSSSSAADMRVTRSISDVVKGKQGQQQPQQPAASSSTCSDSQKVLSGRKSKEERRLSNRQKLMSLKRHSGYLKRPEILETVYSVEEDADAAAAGQQQQQQQQSAAADGDGSGGAADTEEEKTKSGTGSADKPSSTESPPPTTGSGPGSGGTPSSSRSPAHGASQAGTTSGGCCVGLGGHFRYRLDSDMTTSDNDYSTDDDSTRIFYSETSPECSCFSQPESRRSSYGTSCGGGGGGGIYSLPCSRRSSLFTPHTPSSLQGHVSRRCTNFLI